MKLKLKSSISSKLKAIIVLVAFFILSCATTFNVVNEYNILEKDLIYNSTLNSKLIGEYCVTTLLFEDSAGCYDVISKVAPINYICDVTIYDTNRLSFAQFERDSLMSKNDNKLGRNINDTVFSKDNYLNVVKPIYHDSLLYGFIFLRSSYSYINDKINSYILLMLGLLGFTILLTYLIAGRLEKIISKPILKLAKLTNEISITGDYSRKLNIETHDEIGLLYREFNHMLSVINQRKMERDIVELEIRKLNESLELKVIERTKELQSEKEKTEDLLKKSDKLLLNVLPEPIADRLKKGETLIADHFEEASVIFIDIADFTKLSSKSSPQSMAKMLNEIFTEFDRIASNLGLEKIKTIGDCYMAAAGIPIPRNDHAVSVAMMAIKAMESMENYVFLNEDINDLQKINKVKFRIGLDCGPTVAGVIGTNKFIYDLWGDMVNTASRMETHGVIGKIQCTERFRSEIVNKFLNTDNLMESEIIKKNGFPSIQFHERGEIEIKGKGIMKTFFLERK